MRRFGVQLPLTPLAVGDAVDRSAWTPHITLVGNASAPGDPVDLLAAILRNAAARVPVVTAVVGREARFGSGGDVLVDLVDSPDLRPAHDLVLDALEAHVEGFALDEPAHARDGQRFHRTVVAGDRPAPGAVLTADAVVLIELEPAVRPGHAVVLARAELGRPAAAAAMDGGTVHRVLGALGTAGVPAWVIGGWGVDALAGERTREHHDLDLFVGAGRAAPGIDALAREGFVVRSVWSENRWSEQPSGRLLPSAFVAADRKGREVDVHVVDPEPEGRPRSLSDSALVLPPGALDGAGTIDGRPVPCATAAAQLVMHTGYPLPDRQRPDVALLRRLDGH